MGGVKIVVNILRVMIYDNIGVVVMFVSSCGCSSDKRRNRALR